MEVKPALNFEVAMDVEADLCTYVNVEAAMDIECALNVETAVYVHRL